MVALLVTAACTSGATTTGTSSGGPDSGGPSPAATLACRQKDDADTADECAGETGTPRKLDCSLETETKAALAAGCVLEKAGDSDVCCPTTVSGTKEVKVSGCTEPADTLTDSDCRGTPEARKLSCTSSTGQKAGIALGCRAEDLGQTMDFDLCCATNVRGGG